MVDWRESIVYWKKENKSFQMSINSEVSHFYSFGGYVLHSRLWPLCLYDLKHKQQPNWCKIKAAKERKKIFHRQFFFFLSNFDPIFLCKRFLTFIRSEMCIFINPARRSSHERYTFAKSWSKTALWLSKLMLGTSFEPTREMPQAARVKNTKYALWLYQTTPDKFLFVTLV